MSSKNNDQVVVIMSLLNIICKLVQYHCIPKTISQTVQLMIFNVLKC